MNFTEAFTKLLDENSKARCWGWRSGCYVKMECGRFHMYYPDMEDEDYTLFTTDFTSTDWEVF